MINNLKKNKKIIKTKIFMIMNNIGYLKLIGQDQKIQLSK